MAEALVDPLVGGLIQALLHRVSQEANVVISFKNDFKWMSKKLKFLRDVAYDAEDIFEECLLAESDADLSHCYCRYAQCLFCYRMGRRIKDVKDRIKSILEDATELKLVHYVSHLGQTDDYTRISAQTYRKKSSLLGNKSQRVGIEETIEMIIGWLSDPQIQVIAVVGMAGLGKTFLLHHVFKRAKGSFSNSIWLSISQDCSVKQFQCDICHKIGLSSLNHVSEDAAAESNNYNVIFDIRPILRLSYDALPAYLKQCFVYCSAFPEDSEIDVEYLINLWIAEGFIQTENKEDLMDVALSYVNELTDRCLIEVSERFEGFPERLAYAEQISFNFKKYMRMHDLLRDLALSLAKENKCVFDAGKGSLQFLRSQETWGQRRISLRRGEERSIPSPNKCPPLLRTLLLTDNRIIEDPIPATFIGNLKSLRVLDLSSTGISSLPKSIENLKLLRFLNLSHTKIREMTNSVRALKSLQYLDVSHVLI
eukprot:Gb_29699 [translate_table: standard]